MILTYTYLKFYDQYLHPLFVFFTATILTYTYPKFYDQYLHPSFAAENPILMSVLSNSQKHVTTPPFQLETTLHTSGGVVLHNFAKSNDFNRGIYM
jgi:hypothetical protein